MTRETRAGADRSTGSPEEMRAEVERAREQLAGTVAELAARADLRAAAQRKASRARARLRRTAHDAADHGQHRRVPLAAGTLAVALLAAVLLHRHRRGR